MAVTETASNVEHEPIATPIKVILVGAVLAVFEGLYDILNAERYAGFVDGIEVTTTEIVIVTAIAMIVAVVMIIYAHSSRSAPTKRSYLVLGGLSIVVFVIGILFTAFIALLGAAIGFWEVSRTPIDEQG